MNYDLERIKQIILITAKEKLLPYYNRVERRHKMDGSVVTEADLSCQQSIAASLKEHWPNTEFLAEEMTQQQQSELLRSEQAMWCLDPLDGTSNFAAGIPYFCISLALIQNGAVSLGVVYDPLRDECFAADQQHGATLNGQRLTMQAIDLSLKQSTAIVDFKRLSSKLAGRIVNEIPYASQRSFGSVALDWCWLALGRGHVYLHGRSNIWDYAAGNFIFTQAGGHSCTLEGDPIFVQALRPRSSVAAVNQKLFDAWRHWIGVACPD